MHHRVDICVGSDLSSLVLSLHNVLSDLTRRLVDNMLAKYELQRDVFILHRFFLHNLGAQMVLKDLILVSVLYLLACLLLEVICCVISDHF